MFIPNLRTWIEERCNFIVNRIKPGNFGAFVFVTFQTGESQIDEDSQAVVFARNDVIYLMQKVGIVLMQQTVFANIVGSGDDLPPKPCRDIVVAQERSARRARSVSELITSLT